MSLVIKKLMSQPASAHDLSWLKNALQAAIELELSTLPPYLCGQWALEDQSSDAAKLIGEIAMDEMNHLGLASNLLTATGQRPDIFGGYSNIQYPGPLPGGVVPKPNRDFFPFLSDPAFKVVLGFDDFRSFARMCMHIEYPEDPILPPTIFGFEGETFPSIGEFYDAILTSFGKNNQQIPYERKNQLAFRFKRLNLFPVENLQKATEAINLIQKQGEGSPQSPFVAPDGELAHFYRFGKIYFEKEYVFDQVSQKGWWTGPTVKVPQAYKMTPVPLGGYGANAPPEVTECDKVFTQMLRELDQAWVAGGAPNALNPAIRSMTKLGQMGVELLKKQIARPNGGIYGPQFRKFP
jgi:hypothetical protein